MQLAKNVIDVGLSTNKLEPMLRCCRSAADRSNTGTLREAPFIKVNHHAEALAAAAPTGYRELMIAREEVHRPAVSSPSELMF
jgi:hypothetical protein